MSIREMQEYELKFGQLDTGPGGVAKTLGYDDVPFEKFTNKAPILFRIKIYEYIYINENVSEWQLIREHVRDLRKPKNKNWLISVSMWAVTNGKRIEIERK